MSFFLKWFACCQSSKNIEAEREQQEFRLSSPRFLQSPPQNGEGAVPHTVQERLNENDVCNDQTFNRNDDSVSLGPGGGVHQNRSLRDYNNISFEVTKEPTPDQNNKGIQEDLFDVNGKEHSFKEDAEVDKSNNPQDEPEQSSLTKFGVEKKSSQVQSADKEFKRSETSIKEKRATAQSSTAIVGFMEKVKKEEDENPSQRKDATPIFRRNVTREALNSSPRPMNKPK